MTTDKADVMLVGEYRKYDEFGETLIGKDVEQNTKPLLKKEPASPMQDINKALEECRFGRFQIRLLFATLVGIIATTLVNSSTSFLMPLAECDLDMNLKRKGLLTAMPYIEPASPMQDINKALEECRFGRFQIRLLFATLVGIIATTLVNSSTSFLMPLAECDLDMNLKRKGLLTAMPYIGMCVSSIVSGFLVDTFGRIIFLRIGYGGVFFFFLLSASSQTFDMIVISKFFEGFMAAIAISGISSLTAEFCHPNVRDRMMLCQSSFAAVSSIICPAMAWGMLINNWELSLFNGFFVLKTWNFYLFAMSTWAFAAFILYSTLPESPKFLVTQKKYLEARNILIKVYKENNNNADTFPYPNLWDQEIKEEAMKEAEAMKSAKENGHMKEFNAQVMNGMRNMKPLVHRPLLTHLALISIMQLAVVGMYNVLRLWFPQLSTIVEHYKLDENQNLCEALDSYTANEKIHKINSTLNIMHECKPHVSGTETYINSMVIGVISILPFFISGVIVNKVGKKFLMVVTGVITTATLLGSRWASSKTMMVSCFATNIALTQTMKSLTQMVLIEVFPTTMRSLAMAVVMSWARIGTLVGNIVFPILLQQACEIPFYGMTAVMITVILLSIFLPKKNES